MPSPNTQESLTPPLQCPPTLNDVHSFTSSSSHPLLLNQSNPFPTFFFPSPQYANEVKLPFRSHAPQRFARREETNRELEEVHRMGKEQSPALRRFISGSGGWWGLKVVPWTPMSLLPFDLLAGWGMVALKISAGDDPSRGLFAGWGMITRMASTATAMTIQLIDFRRSPAWPCRRRPSDQQIICRRVMFAIEQALLVLPHHPDIW